MSILLQDWTKTAPLFHTQEGGTLTDLFHFKMGPSSHLPLCSRKKPSPYFHRYASEYFSEVRIQKQIYLAGFGGLYGGRGCVKIGLSSIGIYTEVQVFYRNM